MGFLSQMTTQFKKIWSGLSGWQRGTVIGILVLALTGIIALIYKSGQPKMEALYTNLDPANASAIVAKLKEMKVDYRLADEGRSILVPSEDKYQLRLDMAGEVNLNGVVGFETFNETRFGETDTDKRVRFLVALQGELTRTIEELDEVEAAKIHIALPQPSLFIKDQKEPTASVLLRLKAYAQLKPEQVQSIMSFVSHSVEGLKPQNVTIMDINGNLLSEGLAEVTGSMAAATSRISANQLVLKQQYEQELSHSIQSMLERTLGSGKAVVRASVSMDFDQVEKRSEIYGDAVLASEQTKEETSKGRTGQVGGNPADANMGGPSYGSVDSTGDSEYQLSERTRNYEISKTVETTIAAPGKVTRLSVSVLVDGDITTQEQDNITRAVSMAAGIDQNRGDSVAVVGMPFNNAEAEKLAADLARVEAANTRREYIKMGLMGFGLLALLGFMAFLLRYRPALRQPVPAMVGYQENAATTEPVELELESALTPEAAEKKSLKSQIDRLVDKSPEEVAKVLKTWMVEE